MLHKPLTEAEKQLARLFDLRTMSEDFIKNTCQPQYLAAKTPEAREFWTNQARKSKQATDRLLFNPDTHCSECGEPLSLYGHCWQHHWPPLDPAQDAKPNYDQWFDDAASRVDKAIGPICSICDNALAPNGSCPQCDPQQSYCNGQCGICSCILSPQPAPATPTP